MTSPQPWIFSKKFDGMFILLPAFVVTLAVLVFQTRLHAVSEMPVWMWVCLIVCIDVAHVYSTLFRTYFHRHERRQRAALYWLVPLGAWVVGSLLYSFSSMAFWRVLAYLAVFHFVRQQYGFMMLYARGEKQTLRFSRALDKAVIYVATLYPLVYWHCHDRSFEWFIKDDFVRIPFPALSTGMAWLYGGVICAYVAKEFVRWREVKEWNIPKNLLLLGTGLSWYVGIVAFDNDIAFTATNIVAHGIPYLALIWGYAQNEGGYRQKETIAYMRRSVQTLLHPKAGLAYVGVLVLLAFLEEGLWDAFVWREHGNVFPLLTFLPRMDDAFLLAWLVPLLALPQATHYILDAFIWRLNTKDTEWKAILFHAEERKK